MQLYEQPFTTATRSRDAWLAAREARILTGLYLREPDAQARTRYLQQIEGVDQRFFEHMEAVRSALGEDEG